ncbi:MAG: ComEC/Rec2 family competence protein [Pseudomonadota bacterium]
MRSLLLLAGILIALWWPDGWPLLPAWWLAASLLPVMALKPLRAAAPLLLGAAMALHAVARVEAKPPLADGERVMAEARVEGVPALDDSGWQFDAAITFPRHPDWPAQRWRVRLPSAMEAPAPGETWQYALRFDPPRDPAQRRLLLRDHVGASARLVEGPFNHRLAPAAGGIDGLRARLARRISDQVADPSAAALLAALAVGVTGEVSTRQWQVFNATGITHLVAISGMHVTFFAMLSMAAARRLWRRLPAGRWLPRREAFAAGVGIVLALLYALLSGFSVPAQRTVVMLSAFLVARECARCTRAAWSVAAALWAVLLYDPLAALSAGFWLSFLAVGAIVMLAGARLAPAAPLATAVRVQWLVSIALLPVTVAIFGTFSAVGLLANALAIPVFTLLLVPPVLLATACYLVPGVAGWCGDVLVAIAAQVCAALWPFLTWCAGLPGALWHAMAPLGWYLVALPAVLVALLPVAPPRRLAALLLLGSVFLLREPRPRAGELWIDVPPAGAAVALLRTRNHQLLWGTAESHGAGGRAFARHVLPLLRAGPHDVLDLWLPGTLTRDVQAALALGAATAEVRSALLPPARAAPPEMQHCMASAWHWDGLDFELAPRADGRACEVTARAGDVILRVDAGVASRLPARPGQTLRLVMDANGIRQRRRHLRL